MSAAAPTANAGAAAPVKKGKKKLIVSAAAVLLLLALAGGGAAILLKKKAVHDAESGEETSAKADDRHAAKVDLKRPPTFLPLDPFVVNLADKDADRYAQVGITLEVEDAKFAEQMKSFMPAIRNGILMILAHKSSRELLERSGKTQLAGEILRESARTMGIEVDQPEPVTDKPAAPAQAAEDDSPKLESKRKPKRAPAEPNPIRRVHFSNFIVQ